MKRYLGLAFAGVLAAIVAGCGGGGGGPITTPSTNNYAGVADVLGEDCEYAVGVITTRSGTASGARNLAYRTCESAATTAAAGAARDRCDAGSTTGCSAIAVGTNSSGRCRLSTRSSQSLSAAQSAALQGCRSGLGSTASCSLLVSGCASGSPSTEVWRPRSSPPPSPTPSPSPTPTPSPGPDTGTPLRDVNVTIPASCARQVQVCVRDHECEDGDQIRVSLNGSVIFSGELFNAWNCQNVPVQQGANRFELFAINGTGFKGNCSHSDANTGEIVITGGNTRGTQSWEHRGGAGSSANLNVTIGPSGGTCTPTGSQPGSGTGPGTGTGLFGAIATSVEPQCRGRYAGAAIRNSQTSARSAALANCRSAGGTQCSFHQDFGSAYTGNVDCASVAYGERTSGTTTFCNVFTGDGGSESAAEAAALSECRSQMTSCSILPSRSGGNFTNCAR